MGSKYVPVYSITTFDVARHANRKKMTRKTQKIRGILHFACQKITVLRKRIGLLQSYTTDRFSVKKCLFHCPECRFKQPLTINTAVIVTR